MMQNTDHTCQRALKLLKIDFRPLILSLVPTSPILLVVSKLHQRLNTTSVFFVKHFNEGTNE